MLPINKNISQAKKIHSKAVDDFFNKPRIKPIRKQIDIWIKKVFGATHNLMTIVDATPTEIDALITHYESVAFKPKPNRHIKYIRSVYSNYFTRNSRTYLSHSKDKYTAYSLVKNLGITICPYCDRNFIINIPRTNRRTSELDHFYSKDIFPFLALSFYNLIPCCHSCNHLKSNSQIRILNPYSLLDDDSLKFKLSIIGNDFYTNAKSFRLRWLFKRKKAKEHFRLFQLQNLYPTHKDIILEVIQKKYIYNEGYLAFLLKKISKGKLDSIDTEDALINLILGFEIDNPKEYNRPLTKLVRDIWKDLENYKSIL